MKVLLVTILRYSNWLLLIAALLLLLLSRANRVTTAYSASEVYVHAALSLQEEETAPALSLLAENSLPSSRRELLSWLTGITLVYMDHPVQAAQAWQFLEDDTAGELDGMLRDLSRQYEVNDQLPKATQLLKGWVARVPADWNRHHFLGDFYLRHNHPEAARSVFENGAKATTDAGSAFLAGRGAEVNEDWPAARAYYEQAISSGDASILVYFRQAVLLNRRFRDPVGAIRACEEGIRLAPDHYACYEQLGLVHTQLGEWQKARDWYATGFDNVDRSSYQRLFIRHLVDLAALYEREGDVIQALTIYRMIQERDAENMTARDGIDRLSVSE